MKYTEIIQQASVTQISIGMSGLALFEINQLEDEQIGYSIDPQGVDLTGNSDGDWKKEWIVIGYDTLLGDPIFIDTQTDEYPVFTAMHGAGDWNPTPVSPSLSTFLKTLEIMQSVQPYVTEYENTNDRETLNLNISNTLTSISKLHGDFGVEYWKTGFGVLIEELDERI